MAGRNLERCGGDVLELEGDDVAGLRETDERGLVAIGRLPSLRCHLERRAVLFRRINRCLEAKLRRSHREKAAELASTKNAYGRAGRSGSGRIGRPLRNLCRSATAPCLDASGKFRIAKRENLRCEQASIDSARLANGERSNGHTCRHLYD